MLTDKKSKCCNLDIWGGIECTINRIGDIYLDQLQLSQHYHREGDIDAIASLGIKALRYPVLWEHHQPELNTTIDWRWTSKQLEQIRFHNIEPIVGLVHHGSGPSFTNLADDNFPQLLASYAKQVAEKFPWVNYYTPVNEPLTTARFSGLYGIWYPHKKSDSSFLKILLNELKAVVLSMQEIRKVNPNAKLVQTEDLAKTYSTQKLQYQANFENKRRWLSYDLLCGKLTSAHPLWDYLLRIGIAKEQLAFFIENACPPDILGVNFYVTSERYLDENKHHYHPATHGGNGIHEYADVEAIRIPLQERHGFQKLIEELWQRYQIPIAVTEAHLHCSREDQMRWFHHIYNTSKQLQQQGVNIIAVTAWSLLGAYGWNKLLTSTHCEYESGVFDVSSGQLRPTGLASMIKALSLHGTYDHPALEQPGWWQRDSRFFSNISPHQNNMSLEQQSTRPVLIIGKNGTLGNAFTQICNERYIPFVALNRQEVDICNSQSITKAIKQYHPWAIINAAGYINIDTAEVNQLECFNINTTGAKNLAEICEKQGIKLLTFSADQVFDGSKNDVYHEDDKVCPINIYGKSKAIAEAFVHVSNRSALIVRSSTFFSPNCEQGFLHRILNQLREDKHINVPDNIFISPTYVPDLAATCMDLLLDDEKGIWHVANHGVISYFDLAREAAMRVGLPLENLHPVTYNAQHNKAKRPNFSALTTKKGMLLPSIEYALDRYMQNIAVAV